MKSEQGSGTVRTVKNRTTGEVVGYRALLPREHSTAPDGIRNPDRYQEPIGGLCSTDEDARALLNAVLVELTEKGSLKHGLPFSLYVESAIKALLQEARRLYKNDAKANKRVASWRSVKRIWLPLAAWNEWPPSAITTQDLQTFINWLSNEAEGSSGEPLSGSFIRHVASVVRAAFDVAGIQPNPTLGLKLPKKAKPEIRFLDIRAQRSFFSSTSEKITLADRTMAGCGMGAGLRVNELLALKPDDVRLDCDDPHLTVRFGGQHSAPTKGRSTRRVELFEPGLGFWRIWMREFFLGTSLVFEGPRGGYLKSWPERFPEWAELAGVDHLSSHIMRHTYAVAVLSGTWGYDPKSIEFVSRQLGHTEITTTQRYYGQFEAGVWAREVGNMTGRNRTARRPITARELLGLDASNDASDSNPPEETGNRIKPRHSPNSQDPLDKTASFDASSHQALVGRLRGTLDGYGQGARPADAQSIELLRDATRCIETLAERIAELEATARDRSA